MAMNCGLAPQHPTELCDSLFARSRGLTLCDRPTPSRSGDVPTFTRADLIVDDDFGCGSPADLIS